MRGWISGLVLFLISIQALSQKNDYWLRVHDKNDEYGYVDKNGISKIPLGKYSICYTDTFRNYGIVLFPQKGFFAIDRKQKKLFEVFPFDNGPDHPHDGLFRIVDNGLIGFVDTRGKIVIKPRFRFAFPFSDGLAAYCEGCVRRNDGEHVYWLEGKWGFIDKTGMIIIAPAYESISQRFEGDKARVKLKGEEFWIDKQGNKIKP